MSFKITALYSSRPKSMQCPRRLLLVSSLARREGKGKRNLGLGLGTATFLGPFYIFFSSISLVISATQPGGREDASRGALFCGTVYQLLLLLVPPPPLPGTTQSSHWSCKQPSSGNDSS